MATQAEKQVVNAAGMVQGLALVTFPAAAMGLWSFAVARRRPSPVSLHPRPG